MPPKLSPKPPPKPPNPGWKTSEQLEFLLSYWPGFKRTQGSKTFDRFWQKLFEEWYTRWPIVPTLASRQEHGSPEVAQLMLQKEKSAQIKNWFSNRCRGVDNSKVGRGDLKLDLNTRRKLAPTQAYCSYAWDSGLREIVLARWEQQKASATFNDDEDPPEDADGLSTEACIPLAFKLKIVKEVYEGLTADQKKAIDVRWDEDRKKLYRSPHEIEDNGERIAKLEAHQRNRLLIPKSLLRILKNLEDQTGCISQLIIASVDPKTGGSSIQKFCQGRTEQGLTFEDFYGDQWEENVEQKFGEWAIWVFGEQDSQQRKSYILSGDSASPQELMPEASASSSSSTQSNSPQNLSTPATSSRKQVPRPTASRKTKSRPAEPQISEFSSQPLTPKEPVPQSIPRAPPSSIVSTTQVVGVSALPQNMPTPCSIPPASGTTVNPLPSAGEPNADNTNNMALLATALGIHQLLSQVSVGSQVAQVPSVPASEVTQVSSMSTSEVQLSSMSTSKNPNIVEQTQLTLDPTQLSIDPSQVTVDPTQSLPESSVVSAEVVVTQPPSSALSQPITITVDPVAVDVTPNVWYRTRGSGTMISEKPSRQSSIDGAPDILTELHTTSTVPLHQDSNDSDIQEAVVDLSDYISIVDDSDEESQVSSSQKTSDECRDLLPLFPPPSSQWRNSSLGKSQSTLTRTHAQLDVDEGDLPTWMLKKSQWKYVASTAGGPAWEKLLKAYIEQERRLEFTDMLLLPSFHG